MAEQKRIGVLARIRKVLAWAPAGEAALRRSEMALTPKTVIRIGEIASTYLEAEETIELARMFDLALPEDLRGHTEDEIAQEIVREACLRLEHASNRSFIETLLEQAELRSGRAYANTSWEKQEFHGAMRGTIAQALEQLGEPAVPSEVVVAEGQEFTAKAEVRDFFANADDQILVVDPWVGVVTLDCFRSVQVPIRLLTGTRDNSVESGFADALVQFRNEDFEIEVRRHDFLHDRHAVFNERCWLIGSSLKDAGRKQLNCIEMTDMRRSVIEALEGKWSEGQAL